MQGLSRVASDILLGTFTFPWKAEEGLSAPYGKGRGDVSYESVVVNYLRHILPGAFTAQFTFLYSFHPYKWSKEEVKVLVADVMDRHKKEAAEAWQRRQDAVEKGEAGPSVVHGAVLPRSFFVEHSKTDQNAKTLRTSVGDTDLSPVHQVHQRFITLFSLV